MQVTEPGFYWVLGVNSDVHADVNKPTIAQLYIRDNRLYWAICLWECGLQYSELTALHQEPLTIDYGTERITR